MNCVTIHSFSCWLAGWLDQLLGYVFAYCFCGIPVRAHPGGSSVHGRTWLCGGLAATANVWENRKLAAAAPPKETKRPLFVGEMRRSLSAASYWEELVEPRRGFMNRRQSMLMFTLASQVPITEWLLWCRPNPISGQYQQLSLQEGNEARITSATINLFRIASFLWESLLLGK